MKTIFTLILILQCLLLLYPSQSQWKPANTGIEDENIYKIIGKDGRLFAYSEAQGLLISEDSGENWISIGIGGGWCEDCLLSANDTIFCASSLGFKEKIFWSNDYFKTWHIVEMQPSIFISTIEYNNNKLFVGTDGGKLYLSLDLGVSWVDKTDNFNQSGIYGNVPDILIFNNRFFITLWGDPSWGKGIFYSDDNLETFSQADIQGENKRSLKLAAYKELLFSTAEGMGYVSNDSGKTWIQINQYFNNLNFLPGYPVYSFYKNYYIFGGFDGGKILLSSDNGDNWIKKDDGLDYGTNCLAIIDDYIFAGTAHGIYRARLDELTAVDDKDSGIIKNSINCEVRTILGEQRVYIHYNMEVSGPVTISIYDNLGNLITTYYRDYWSPDGKNTQSMSLRNYISGVYHVVINSNNCISRCSFNFVR